MVRRKRLGLWSVMALLALCIAGFASAALASNPGNGNGNAHQIHLNSKIGRVLCYASKRDTES